MAEHDWPATPEAWRECILALVHQLAADVRDHWLDREHVEVALTPHERLVTELAARGVDAYAVPVSVLLKTWPAGAPSELRNGLRLEFEAYVGLLQTHTRDAFPSQRVEPDFWRDWVSHVTLGNAFDATANRVWATFGTTPRARTWQPRYMAESEEDRLERTNRLRRVHTQLWPQLAARADAASDKLVADCTAEMDQAFRLAERFLTRDRAERLSRQALHLSDPIQLAPVLPDQVLVTDLYVAPPTVRGLELRLTEVEKWLRNAAADDLPSCYETLHTQADTDATTNEARFAQALRELNAEDYLVQRGRLALRRVERTALVSLLRLAQRTGLDAQAKLLHDAVAVCDTRIGNIERKLAELWGGDDAPSAAAASQPAGLGLRARRLARAAVELGIGLFWAYASRGLLGDHEVALRTLARFVSDHASEPRVAQRNVHSRVTTHVSETAQAVCEALEPQRHSIEEDLNALREALRADLETNAQLLLEHEWKDEMPLALTTPSLKRSFLQLDAPHEFPPDLTPTRATHQRVHELVTNLCEHLGEAQRPPPWNAVVEATHATADVTMPQPWGWYRAHLRTWTSAFAMHCALDEPAA